MEHILKNPYFRLDNFPFFSSDFPVRNFLSTYFPFSCFSREIAMPSANQGIVFPKKSSYFKDPAIQGFVNQGPTVLGKIYFPWIE